MTASLRHLLTGIIDYAGLFPPARLDMPNAVREYKWLQADESASWILGRFVCPADRLVEMEAEAGDDAFEVCVTGQGFSDIERLGELQKSRALAYESKLALNEIADAKYSLGTVQLFVEVPLVQTADYLQAIQSAGVFAKIRTGGVEPIAFPPAARVAEFLCACAQHAVSFKATAGLHHPIYHHSDEYGIMMHGFLNVFLGAALAMKGGAVEAVQQVLEVEEPAAFEFGDATARVLDYHFSLDDLEATRKFAMSFGSCSVTEPLEDLESLRLLPA